MPCFTLYSKAKFTCYSGVSWLPSFAFHSPIMKMTYFLGVSSRIIIIVIVLTGIYWTFLVVFAQWLCSVQLLATPLTAALQVFCPFLSPGVCSYSCPLSMWCHPTIYLLSLPSPVLNFSQHQGLTMCQI